jgi:hypothetical protein
MRCSAHLIFKQFFSFIIAILKNHRTGFDMYNFYFFLCKTICNMNMSCFVHKKQQFLLLLVASC